MPRTCAPQTVEELEDRLSEPNEQVVEVLRRLPGDLLVLGVGGKMGPTLARMAERASRAAGVPRQVIGVSRFSRAGVRQRLESWGVRTIQGDLLDERFVQSLPEAAHVVFMAGFKFGAAADPCRTWAVNCYLPSLVSRRYRDSRMVVFSSGNVYGMVPTGGSGSVETDAPRPVGEYAMAVLGRERIFEHFSRTLGIPMALLRLNYACEMRYGVLVDLALQLWAGQPIDLSMGCVNVIWQTDAIAMALASLAHTACPPLVVNIAGPEKLRVRDVCAELGRLMSRPVQLTGTEAPDAFLSDGRRGYGLLGRPAVRAETLIGWTADWVRRGGPTLSQPTKFQRRDGKF